ncbi:MAG: ribonuclease R [bacterium]|nr:ribonuclease R [bacterium]
MKEEIIAKLKEENKGLTLIEINDLLGLNTVEEYKELQKEITTLVSDGLIHKSKKDKFILMEKCSSLLTGILHINKNGNGFVDTKYDEDTFIRRENLNGAVDGDFVEIDVQNDEGIIVNILKRDLNLIVGEIVKDKKNNLIFKLDDKKKQINIKLTKESLEHLVEGHKVLVQIIKEIDKNLYLGKVVKVIGHKNDPGVDIMTIACKHEIFLDISETAKKQVENMETVVSNNELVNRKDLRNEMIFTIDGDDTKDIDDAISIRKDCNNYILGVHIADVSHYVNEGTPLYDSAYEKGTSAYLADTVLPMLPHELSNGICSLNEGVDRLTISCEMTINNQGKVLDHDIFLSVINSKKKMTYKNVNKILLENNIPEGYEPFVNNLKLMQELANILRKEKINRGYIDFDLDEAKIVQDENGKAIDVIKRTQDAGEKLIEDFMIIANETVATHIYNMDLPFVYRIHGTPNSEKIEDFLNFVKLLGYRLDISTVDLTPKKMQEILENLHDKKEFEILSDMLLRSMKKAIYSSNNIGHFGLASKIYTHFTSPIRRFPDLMVHTLLHKYLFENKIDMETIRYYENYLPSACEHASKKEVDAQEAEREVLDMKMAEYMENYIGQTYNGIISGITNFGLFVKLPNLIEGLVHISSLNGFYTYVPELLSLVCDNKIKYSLGQNVKVKLVGASKENSTIDFEIVEIDSGN